METPQSMTLAGLFPELPAPGRRYEVKVTLVRDAAGAEPGQGQALAELTAAALCADGLLTVWSGQQAVLSMILDAADDAEALAAGVAVVRAIGGARGATVSASPLAAPVPL